MNLMNKTNLTRRSTPAALALYFVHAAAATLIMAAAVLIGTALNIETAFVVVIALLITAVGLLHIRRAKGGLRALVEGPYISKYIALSLILPAIALCMGMIPLSASPVLPPPVELFAWIITLLATVSWEELLLRHLAVLLLGRRGAFSFAGAAGTGIVCGLCCFASLLFSVPFSDVLPQALLAACAALFLLALYLRTKNIFVSATANFLMRFAVRFFPLFSASETKDSVWPLTLLYSATLLIVGGILLIRGKHVEPEK